jgi:uncharacterized membrane protein YccC
MFLKRFTFLLHPSGDIEVARGVRTLLAMGVPIAIGHSLHQAEQGLSVALAAQILLLADVGGLYSVRAKTLIGTVLGMALALALGTWVSSWFGLMLGFVFVGLFLAGYLTVYGENGAAAGLVIGLAFLFAITLPPGGVIVAIERAAVAIVAGIWTILLALWFWPFQPNQPLRLVVAQNFQGLASYLRRLGLPPAAAGNEERENRSLSQTRQLLLQSRATLAYTRMGRWGHSDLRELLIVLIEDCDRMMTTLTTMQELLHLHPFPQLTTVGILLEDILQQVAAITEDIAQLILGKTQKKPDCHRLKLLIAAIEQQQRLQERTLETDVDDYASYVAVGQLKKWLKKLEQQLELATQTAQQLHQRDCWQGATVLCQRRPTEADGWKAMARPWWEPLQDNFSLDSPLFRHALRLGLGATLGVLIYTFARIPHGLWIGLTLVIVLKPDFSLTFQRFVYRMIGTLLGAGAASLLLSGLDDPLWLEGIGVVSMAIALALVRFHYSLAVFFVTLFALIVSQLYPPSASLEPVGARLLCTLIGGAIAFALSFGLLRLQEDVRFSQAAVRAIEALNCYFQSVMAVYLGEADYQPTALIQIRNQTRLANTQMQAALQRLLDDPSTPFVKMEPAITLANYIPRLGRGVTVLLSQLEQYQGTPPHPQVMVFSQQVQQVLTQLARSLKENTPPPPLPPLETTVQEILTHLQQLREERLSEMANHQDGTATHQYLQDYNIVAADLLEIARRLGAIDTAVERFEMAI